MGERLTSRTPVTHRGERDTTSFLKEGNVLKATLVLMKVEASFI